jgi:hypothetical protein
MSEGELHTAIAENEEEQRLIDESNEEEWTTWKFLSEISRRNVAIT